MKTACAALAALLLYGPAFAQTTPPPAPPAPPGFPPDLTQAMIRIRDAALADDYAYKQLAHLTNNIGPRLSGSAQAQAAVDYVAAEMKRDGLDVTLEKTMVPHWVRGTETAELVQWPDGAPGTTQKIVLTALGGGGSTPEGGLTADVVVVKNFDELQALGPDKVSGKIVLFNHRFDKELAAEGLGLEAYLPAREYRGEGPNMAAKMGARAALVRSIGSADFRLPHAGWTEFEKDVTPIPAAAVTDEDADLLAALTAEGTVRMHLTLTPRMLPPAPSYNVVADLKGSEHSEEVVLVSGHLDSWDLGTGAIDDGAGVVMAMEAAHILRELRLQPKRTIRVVAWMSEENGSAGAMTYAQEHAAELPSHVAAIESDLGADHPVGFSYTGRQAGLDALKPISRVLESFGAGLSTMVSDTEADITPLAEAGVPAIGLWQDSRTYFHYHHTAADTLDKVDPKRLAENAAVMSVLAYGLANMPQPPVR